eukprot:3704376-Ditylum_brightwellii.AAC.1
MVKVGSLGGLVGGSFLREGTSRGRAPGASSMRPVGSNVMPLLSSTSPVRAFREMITSIKVVITVCIYPLSTRAEDGICVDGQVEAALQHNDKLIIGHAVYWVGARALMNATLESEPKMDSSAFWMS